MNLARFIIEAEIKKKKKWGGGGVLHSMLLSGVERDDNLQGMLS